MCFISSLTLSTSQLKARFKAELESELEWNPMVEMNGFAHPKTPIIASDKPNTIQLFEWGLLPSWAKDKSFQKNTLNARIETLGEKPSFKHILSNRCLIPATGFYEWQWLDQQGKKKQKYFITVEGEESFTFAGLWSTWEDRSTGEILKTYTIITQQATGIMAEIHNSKLRMPWILPQKEESNWLSNKMVVPTDIHFHAKPINNTETLF